MLRDAQVSKRLLLLRALRLSTVLGSHPAWRVLDAAADQRPDTVRSVLSRPFVDLWATRALQAASAGSSVPAGTERYLTGLTAAAALMADVPFEFAISGDAGPLVLPGLGRIEPVDAGVLSHRDGARIRWTGATGATDIRPGDGTDQDGWWTAYRTVRYGDAATGGEVELDDLDPHRSSYGLPPVNRLAPAAARRWTALIRAAMTLVETELPVYWHTVRGCLRSLVPVAAPNAGTTSASNQRAFGAVAVSVPADADELALLMIHETQHAKLSALLDLVDLVDPDDSQLFHAPWRTDPRPAGALLQGSYAHAAVAGFWRTHRHSLAGGPARGAEFEHIFWRDQARVGADTLLASRALTPLGRSFVERLAESLAGQVEPAHPAVSAAVSACTTVNDVHWRLSNHAVLPAQTEALAAAYRSGAPCPPLPLPQVRPGASRGAAMSQALAQDIRRQAVDLAAPAGVPGIHVPSVAELDRRLRADPADTRAWALLALALAGTGRERTSAALVQRPGLVRALAMGLPRTAPSALADWLSTALPASAAAPAPH